MTEYIRSLTRSNTTYIPTIHAILTGMLLGGLIDMTSMFMNYPFWVVAKYYLLGFMLSWFVYFCTGCLGVTMTFHRFFSHKSFEFLYSWMPYVGAFFGSLGATGSLIGWTMFHRLHHRHSDTKRDPHSPVQHGAMILLGAYGAEFNKYTVRDLINNRFHRFMHEYYYAILLAWIVLAWALGGMWLMYFGVLMPMCIQIWASNISNYVNHSGKFGYRDYPTAGHDNSHNVPWLSWLTWGEGGGHNYHHRFPGDYRFAKSWWDDPTGAIIPWVAK